MLAMTSSVVAVHGAQSLREFTLVAICVHLGTKPFTKLLHGLVTLRLHFLPALRATFTKEPCEAIYEHLSTLSRRIPHSAHRCTIGPLC